MKISLGSRTIQSSKDLSYINQLSDFPKLHKIQKKESLVRSSFLTKASDYISDKLIEVGDWWSMKKSVNNDTTKRALEDSENLLEMLKNTTGKITYKAINGIARVANATTSVLDITESYSNDIKNNRRNLPETLNTVVKGTSQSIIGGIVTTGVISAVGVGTGIVGFPIVVGGLAGGLAAYGAGKVYDYFSAY